MSVKSCRQVAAAPPKYLNAVACGARYGFSPRHWMRLVDAGRAPSRHVSDASFDGLQILWSHGNPPAARHVAR